MGKKEIKDEDWEKLLFQELSEDRRHIDTLLWEIPTAIFLVDSFLLGLIGVAAFPLLVSKIVISFGLVYTIILTYSLFKHVKRAIKRALWLKMIEKQKGLPRYGKDEPGYLRAPLGYSMVFLLVGFILFLIYLLMSPQLLSQLPN